MLQMCIRDRYEKDQAVLDVFRKLDTETELPSEIILFQGLPKGDKMEWLSLIHIWMKLSHL